jgi:hypothetical protein
MADPKASETIQESFFDRVIANIRRNRGKYLLWLLAILIIIALGTYGYKNLSYFKENIPTSESSTLQSAGASETTLLGSGPNE